MSQKVKTVQDKKGNVVELCTYEWTDPDGHVEKCFAHGACPVCRQCSRLDGEKERGHCTGHLGLKREIPVPGNDAYYELRKQQKRDLA